MQHRRLLASHSSEDEKRQSEIAALQIQLEQSVEARNQLQEECTAKLAKAEAAFEQELEALKSAQNSSNEERYNRLKKQFEDLKKDAATAELDAKQKIEDLTNQLLHEEELKSDLTDKCSGLELRETNCHLEINALRKKVRLVFFCTLNLECCHCCSLLSLLVQKTLVKLSGKMLVQCNNL